MTTNVLERSPQLSVLQLEGTLRAPLRGELTHRVRGLLASGERRILLDLTRLSDIDAAGIGELIAAFNTASAACGNLQISQPSARVRQLLEVAGVLPVLSAGARVREYADGQRCQ